MSKIIDLTGQKFGRLKVLGLVYSERRGSLFECRCDCKKRTMVWGYNLRNGHTTSCGCARADAMRLSATKHGMYGDRFYNIYRQIIRRCTEKTHKAYPNYGGKGIQNLWESFEEFKQDMLESYLRHVEMFGEENTTIDRVENTGHYRKTNCRWATWEEQARNKSYPPKTVSIKRNSRKFDCPYCGAGTGVAHKLGCREIERLESGKRVVKYNRKEVV